MAQQQTSAKILSSALTVTGLSLVWVAVATNWPSQEEFSAIEPPVVSAAARPTVPSPAPVLDLTIPTSPPLPSDARIAPDHPAPPPPQEAERGQDRSPSSVQAPPGMVPGDERMQQVARLKCEAEVEQLCPDGAGRAQCLERRATQLPPFCQSQLREKFVKWKEDKSRMIAACDEDAKRYCAHVRAGGGQILQCLQEHAQEVSDRCYQTLPKGKLMFRQ